MSKLTDDARAAYQPVLDESRRQAQEFDERQKRETAEARAEALQRAEKVLDAVLGRHDGLSVYCLLGGMGGLNDIRILTTADAVQTVIYRVDGLNAPLLAVNLKAGTVATAHYMEQTADSDMYGWFLHDRIHNLQDLGKLLHEVRQGRTT